MFSLAVGFAVVAVLSLIAAIATRRRRGVLPRSLVVEYLPAEGSSVLRDAVLAGRDDRAASAALLSLAVRRTVRLLTDTTNAKRSTIAVEVTDPDSLSNADRRLLDAILGPSRADRRVRRFAKDTLATRTRVRALVAGHVGTLERAGMVRGVRPGRPLLRGFAWLAAACAVVVLFAGFVYGDLSGAIPLLVALGCFIATFVITPRGLSRGFTPAATPARRHLDGLRQYMMLAEADRIRALQGPRTAETQAVPASLYDEVRDLGPAVARFRLYEKLLPYAVIFGIEKEWIANLEDVHRALDIRDLDLLDGAASFAVDLFLITELGADVANLAFTAADAASGVLSGIDGTASIFDWSP